MKKELYVQKFGGSSVADTDCLRRVAGRIAADYREGRNIVVVVSAMGKTTDRLIAMAREVHADPIDRCGPPASRSPSACCPWPCTTSGSTRCR